MPKEIRNKTPKIVAQNCPHSGLRWIWPGTAQSEVLGWLTDQMTSKRLATWLIGKLAS
jgi:hypothetical protein